MSGSGSSGHGSSGRTGGRKSFWDAGVAFVMGINFYSGSRRISKKSLLSLVKLGVESDGCVRIVGTFKADNVLFFKRKRIHYATVGQRISKILSKHFGEYVPVTARSARTLRGVCKSLDGDDDGDQKQ